MRYAVVVPLDASKDSPVIILETKPTLKAANESMRIRKNAARPGSIWCYCCVRKLG